MFAFSLEKGDYRKKRKKRRALLFQIWVFFSSFSPLILVLFLTCIAESGAILPASLKWKQALCSWTSNRKWWQVLDWGTIALVLMKYFILSDITELATVIKASFCHWVCVEVDACYVCTGTPHSDTCSCAEHGFLHFMGIKWCLCIIKRV